MLIVPRPYRRRVDVGRCGITLTGSPRRVVVAEGHARGDLSSSDLLGLVRTLRVVSNEWPSVSLPKISMFWLLWLLSRQPQPSSSRPGTRDEASSRAMAVRAGFL